MRSPRASPCGSGSAAQSGDGVRSLQALLGLTRIITNQEDTFGFVDNGTPGPSVGRALLIFNTAGGGSTAGVEETSVFTLTDATTTHGHFLVRPTAAAVPSLSPLALYTLVPGLLVGQGLVALRRRRGRG